MGKPVPTSANLLDRLILVSRNSLDISGTRNLNRLDSGALKALEPRLRKAGESTELLSVSPLRQLSGRDRTDF